MRITLALADQADRESIYAIRHRVYAGELGQHTENALGRLRDSLDEVNTYLVVKQGEEILGFVAITPPNANGYSLDKYFSRADLPFVFDRSLFEVRLLTVVGPHRQARLAFLLMYGALRYVESAGAKTVAAIGRLAVLEMYRRVGFKPLGLRARAGKVCYELMAADVCDLHDHAILFERLVTRLEAAVDWRLDGIPFRRDTCYHGGAFFDEIGDDFETLERRHTIINADVLDAWFDPAPAVVQRLAEHLPFAIKTSPPTACSGMRRAIARARGVAEASILPGAGSSDLIFAGLRHWVRPSSRVLILDPMYGEYAHVLEKVIGARVDRLTLSPAACYDVDLSKLAAGAAHGYDWIVLVNPNSPTGRHIRRVDLERVLAGAPNQTRWWIDETYVDYAGPGETIEPLAASSTNLIVCKSMSKAYALSGVRAAYLCGPPFMVEALRPFCPPWSVSLPGQIASCEALKSVDYYRARWAETHQLREELAAGLTGLGLNVVPGCANFLLCQLPSRSADATEVVRRLRERGMFIRDVANMGSSLDARAVRIAVKDRDTNLAMLEILRSTLSHLNFTVSSGLSHDS
jgi:histidinol-phosphate/aromatic aminotransferase/cobyric acid decarboxylase-like protein